MTKAIWLVPVAALAVALTEMPYGYYQLLRIGIFCLSLFLAHAEHENPQRIWMWAFIALAITYNPIFRMPLGRDVWVLVNLATIALLLAHMRAKRQGG